MKVTLNNTVEHQYDNGENNQFKPINDAIALYHFIDTYENFQSIVYLMKLEYLRGAVNKKLPFMTALNCHIADLALVYKGIKPMCLYEDRLPEFFNQLNLFKIRFKRPRTQYVIYKDENLKDTAESFANYLIHYEKENTEHHYKMGQYLGYPTEDVDFFVSGGLETLINYK
jgi:hypothetical protein